MTWKVGDKFTGAGCINLGEMGYGSHSDYYECHKPSTKVVFVSTNVGYIISVSYVMERQKVSVGDLISWYGIELPRYRVWDNTKRTFVLGNFRKPTWEAFLYAVKRPINYRTDDLHTLFDWVSWVNF